MRAYTRGWDIAPALTKPDNGMWPMYFNTVSSATLDNATA